MERISGACAEPTVQRREVIFLPHVFRPALAGQDERWMTLLHEVLHSVSVGFARDDYGQGPGWEEGVVEQMQRLLRPQALARLSASVPQAVLAEADALTSI